MGHMVGKDLYRKLGRKIDGLTTRAPWNETFYEILKGLYTSEEADLLVRMPYSLATIELIEKTTRSERSRLERILEGMCSKGLVLDVQLRDRNYYIPSPLVIGIFEFTMMRTDGDVNYGKSATLFHEYFEDVNTFYKANFGHNEKISPLRALPHEGTVEMTEYVEVLDYEKATSIVESAATFAIGICSCRHEKLHIGEKKCDVPLENCSSFNASADYLIRHKMAKEVSRTEMLENLACSKEMGLVFNADNVRKNVSFICNCCGCCCNILLGISKYGYPNTVVTSNFMAESHEDTCIECGTCAESCPINAIEMKPDSSPDIDTSMCIGCGVCALNCETGALRLVKRRQRVLHPEDTFEMLILQCLERGTLQNQIFGNPQSLTHSFMRAVVGGFLKLPPVKKALMGDTLRSRFLTALRQRT